MNPPALHETITMDFEMKKLCNYCANLIPYKDSPTPFTATHHANLAMLESSSKSCTVCAVIQAQWSLKTVQERYPNINAENYGEIFLELKVLDIQGSEAGLAWALLSIGFELRPYAMLYLSKISITTCMFNSVHAQQLRLQASSTSLDARLATVGTWLRECKSSHPRCNNTIRQMPKRLIDVGRNGSPPKLVASTELTEDSVKYATLSYCWGESTFKTMKASVEGYHYKIPFEQLPRTYQDAIVFARTLNIQYLWIDALCIVQDDNTEWQEEAARMQDIYAGSELTIAATDAPDGSAGCFPEVDTSPSLHTLESTEMFTTTNSTSGREYLVQIRVGDLRQVTGDSILNTRGWVLQEMVLSHRILHCMTSGLFWQCKTHARFEMGLVFDYSTPAMRHTLSGALELGSESMHRHWWTWMTSYSGREFSFPTDRLPAMAGLVRHYQAASNDKPMLGLWERSFTQDLLWTRMGALNSWKTGCELPNMPSWSWLSCLTMIEFDFWGLSDDESHKEKFQIVTDHSTLVDWDIQWSSEPLVSDIKSTRVVVEGPVIELTFSTSPESLSFTPPYLSVNDEELDFEKSKIPWRCTAQFDSFDAKDSVFPAQYLCLLLRSRVYKIGNHSKEAFLILDPVSESENVYRRIGIGSLRGEHQSFDLQKRRMLELV
ncbi:heterokaryon incompatibility protein-domain-containing protein [Cadophora sp. MPI-SDFR-AT-0126]|nr:heterokaryon incompatibility protein-domain-containing protein [Leotiomycetes sp. MPI-SDFR-AT-0126]